MLVLGSPLERTCIVPRGGDGLRYRSVYGVMVGDIMVRG